MFYVTSSQFVFKIRKQGKEAWSKFERVSLKVVVRTHSGRVFIVGKGRRLNDAEASRAGKANGAYWSVFVIKRG